MHVVKAPEYERQTIVIALEDLDFTWGMSEIQEFREMWELGVSVTWIARHFGRDVDEVALLVMDQCRKDKIKPRPNGIFGREGETNAENKETAR